MKKVFCLLLVLIMSFTLISCGSSEKTDSDNTEKTAEKYIITTSELDGCTLVTTYTFDDDMKLVSVSQKATYTDTSRLTLEYSLVESDTVNFTDLEKEASSFSCTLTEDGINKFYPDATFNSILETANEQELTVETSK